MGSGFVGCDQFFKIRRCCVVVNSLDYLFVAVIS